MDPRSCPWIMVIGERAALCLSRMEAMDQGGGTTMISTRTRKEKPFASTTSRGDAPG